MNVVAKTKQGAVIIASRHIHVPKNKTIEVRPLKKSSVKVPKGYHVYSVSLVNKRS